MMYWCMISEDFFLQNVLVMHQYKIELKFKDSFLSYYIPSCLRTAVSYIIENKAQLQSNYASFHVKMKKCGAMSPSLQVLRQVGMQQSYWCLTSCAGQSLHLPRCSLKKKVVCVYLTLFVNMMGVVFLHPHPCGV